MPDEEPFSDDEESVELVAPVVDVSAELLVFAAFAICAIGT